MAASQISAVFFFLLLTTAVLTTAIPPAEYNSLLSALHSRGYHLFANSISTTDIQTDILSSRNLTFFVPIDTSPDIVMPVSDFINTTRFHIVPNYRLTGSDLGQLPYGMSIFPTLVPRREIFVIKRRECPLWVEDVKIAIPDLYHDKNVVVHGIEKPVEFHSYPEVEFGDHPRCGVTPTAPINYTGEDYEHEYEEIDINFRKPAYLTPRLRNMTLMDFVNSYFAKRSGDVTNQVSDGLSTGTSELAAKYSGDDDVEGFSLMGDNKMIDCATAVEDGYRRELYTPASMPCAN